MIEELVCRVFTARNAAHIAHWKADTLSMHEALGDFYGSVIDKVDGLVEAYQGYFGLVGNIPAVKDTKGELVAVLSADAAWVSKNRSQIAKNVPALENIVDDLVGLYLTTIYKLRFLKS